MMQRANATRIGLFTIGGIVLLVGAVVLLAGGRLFADTERAVLYFDSSVQGLREGAAVVLRGVRLGSVRSIDLVSDGEGFRVPVVIDIDSGLIRQATGHRHDHFSIRDLVQRGLTAKLATQSLLTGAQYIDLDLRPGKIKPVMAALAAEASASSGPGAAGSGSAAGGGQTTASINASSAGSGAGSGAGSSAGSAAATSAMVLAARGGMPQIPTEPPLLQALQAQVEQIDIPGLLRETRSTLAAARKLADGPEMRQTLGELTRATASLARLSNALERRVPRLADSAQTTLARAGDAVGKVGNAADRFGAVAVRADALLQPDSSTLASVRRAADEMAQSASALRQVSAGDAPTVLQLQQTLAEVGRAARGVRQLADLLDQQPGAVLRGRSDER